MKIRIRGNSVRIRITQTELKNFGLNGELHEETCFGPGDNQVFRYQLLRSDRHERLTAGISNNTITVFMPFKMAVEWVTTNRITFEDNMDIGNGMQLRILIEKDFACIDHTTEDQSDMFENPNREHKC